MFLFFWYVVVSKSNKYKPDASDFIAAVVLLMFELRKVFFVFHAVTCYRTEVKKRDKAS